MPDYTGRELDILMFALGTAGDVHPSIGIGKELQRRGHHVLFVANSYFENAVERAGLAFLSSGSREQYLQTIENPDLWRFGKGFRVLLAHVLEQMRGTYEIIAQRYVKGRTLIIAPSSAFGARLANEKLGARLINLHLQPIVLRSLKQQPGIDVPVWARPFVPPLRRFLLAAVDRWVLNPMVLPALNDFRAELGLSSLQRIFDDWIHSPDLVIGLFPDWFAPVQPDWPHQLRLTGFPLYDEAADSKAPEELLTWLDKGERPLVFALGSGMRLSKDFIATSIEVCRRLGRRGVLLTPFREQIPAGLPDSIRYFDYVPFSVILPRSAALVHHGGVGTTAQALRAGIPQLITPFNFDQPDNAARVRRLGAGDLIRPHKYEPNVAARKLEHLIASPEVASRARTIAARFKGVDPIGDTCRLIESVVIRTRAAAPAL